MKTLSTLALAAMFSVPVMAADPSTPDADQLLRQMSATLAKARHFSVEATREIDPALLGGHDALGKARISASVQRPDKISARVSGRSGSRRFVATGRTLYVLDEKQNYYAAVPMRRNIDGLVDELDKTFGFVPPLAEFAVSNPYAELRRDAQTVRYLGRDRVGAGFLGLGGVDCHRLALKGRTADAELWISVTDHLPRQLVATFHRAGQPQVKVRMSSWNLAAPASAAEFAFTPPSGAQKIEMWSTARMRSALHR